MMYYKNGKMMVVRITGSADDDFEHAGADPNLSRDSGSLRVTRVSGVIGADSRGSGVVLTSSRKESLVAARSIRLSSVTLSTSLLDIMNTGTDSRCGELAGRQL